MSREIHGRAGPKPKPTATTTRREALAALGAVVAAKYTAADLIGAELPIRQTVTYGAPDALARLHAASRWVSAEWPRA